MKKRPAKKTQMTVGVIIYAHAEGRLLHPTIKSIIAAYSATLDANIASVSIYIVADNPSAQTQRYAKEYPKSNVKIINVKYGNKFKSINYAVGSIRDEYILIITAGDLLCQNWFTASEKYLKKDVILHPQFEYGFGSAHTLKEVLPFENTSQIEGMILENDVFSSVMYGKRKTFSVYPFEEDVFFQDSAIKGWNIQTLKAGIEHSTVPCTVFAKRIQDTTTAISRNILPPVKLLPGGQPMHAVDISYKFIQQMQPKNTKNKTLSSLRKTTDWLFRAPPITLLRSKSGRLRVYFDSMRNETLHLFRPVVHYTHKEFPQWLDEQIKYLCDLDLQVYHLDHVRQSLQYPVYQSAAFTEAYSGLASKIGSDIDILLIVPYLKNGGAERELQYLLSTIMEERPTYNIKFITTERSESSWSGNFKNIECITPPEAYWHLSHKDQAKLIAELVVQLRPQKLHIMNSVAGYYALEEYSGILAQYTKIFLTIFSIDKTVEGMDTHVFAYKMRSAIDDVTKVFTDNKTVVGQLCELLAIPESKFSVHRQPVAVNSNVASLIDKRFSQPPLRILWAGRLDRQKRPDILLRVAESCAQKGLGVTFDVYGSSAFEFHYQDDVAQSSYVKYKGAYDGGLQSLPLHQYDVFLLTSEWEGMPNVLLEAISQGLTVIAPSVGGVAELISSQKTGYLISDFSNISQYVDTIEGILSNSVDTKRIAKGAVTYIENYHSWKTYKKQIQKETEYIT